MKKILITGANGLLGQKLVSLLSKQQNCKLIATARGDARFLVPENIIYQSLDITDADACVSVIGNFRPDAIIHAAAMTQVDACETERELCDSINIQGTRNMIRAIGNGNTHFVHISTDFIYEGDEEEYFEDSKVTPLSYYGESKWESEKLFKKVNFPYSILRTVLVYGVLDDLSRSNIVLWAKGALAKGQEINVVDDQYRCPTLAEDLALSCLQVIEEKAIGVFHVSGKEFMSILELVIQIADYWKLDKNLINPIKTSSLNQAAKRPVKTKLNINKAIKQFNYQPKSFSQGLALVDIQLQNLKPQ
jgi:dTDP-4-dehydrorhamnose reductase